MRRATSKPSLSNTSENDHPRVFQRVAVISGVPSSLLCARPNATFCLAGITPTPENCIFSFRGSIVLRPGHFAVNVGYACSSRRLLYKLWPLGRLLDSVLVSQLRHLKSCWTVNFAWATSTILLQFPLDPKNPWTILLCTWALKPLSRRYFKAQVFPI